MEIKPIRTKADYRATLKEVETLMRAEPGTADGERLDVLATLVEAYERKHFPLDLPDPVEAIKFRMEQSGLGPKDLVPMIGQLNRVYEILSRRRPLTLAMIRALHEKLGIPSELLIREPAAEYRVAKRTGKKRAKGGSHPIEMYSHKRAREFDKAEADGERLLSRKKKRAR
jgi:HTH-type transcriptional regulator/antitoxin HigA